MNIDRRYPFSNTRCWLTLLSSEPSRLKEGIWLVWPVPPSLTVAACQACSGRWHRRHLPYHDRYRPWGLILWVLSSDPLLDWSPVDSEALNPSAAFEGIGVVDSWEVSKSVRVPITALRSDLLGSTVSLPLRCLFWLKWILLRIRSALKRRVMRDLLSAWLRSGWYNQSLSPCGANGCIVTGTLVRSVVIILGMTASS